MSELLPISGWDPLSSCSSTLGACLVQVMVVHRQNNLNDEYGMDKAVAWKSELNYMAPISTLICAKPSFTIQASKGTNGQWTGWVLITMQGAHPYTLGTSPMRSFVIVTPLAEDLLPRSMLKFHYEARTEWSDCALMVQCTWQHYVSNTNETW